jgi:cell wall-associated NlpC family hydrolase
MTSSATLPSRHRRILSIAFVVMVGSTHVAMAQDATVTRRSVKPFAAWSASVHSLRDSLVSVARAQVGTKYVRGGQDPQNGFDCSGLVRYVMAALSVKLPRTAAQQANTGLAVVRDTTRLRPGDLLTFGKGKRGGVSHIGIYVGSGRYVHASSVAGQVIESDLSRTGSPLIRAWRGVRRVVTGADSSSRNGDG